MRKFLLAYVLLVWLLCLPVFDSLAPAAVIANRLKSFFQQNLESTGDKPAAPLSASIRPVEKQESAWSVLGSLPRLFFNPPLDAPTAPLSPTPAQSTPLFFPFPPNNLTTSNNNSNSNSNTSNRDSNNAANSNKKDMNNRDRESPSKGAVSLSLSSPPSSREQARSSLPETFSVPLELKSPYFSLNSNNNNSNNYDSSIYNRERERGSREREDDKGGEGEESSFWSRLLSPLSKIFEREKTSAIPDLSPSPPPSPISPPPIPSILSLPISAPITPLPAPAPSPLPLPSFHNETLFFLSPYQPRGVAGKVLTLLRRRLFLLFPPLPLPLPLPPSPIKSEGTKRREKKKGGKRERKERELRKSLPPSRPISWRERVRRLWGRMSGEDISERDLFTLSALPLSDLSLYQKKRGAKKGGRTSRPLPPPPLPPPSAVLPSPSPPLPAEGKFNWNLKEWGRGLAEGIGERAGNVVGRGKREREEGRRLFAPPSSQGPSSKSSPSPLPLSFSPLPNPFALLPTSSSPLPPPQENREAFASSLRALLKAGGEVWGDAVKGAQRALRREGGLEVPFDLYEGEGEGEGEGEEEREGETFLSPSEDFLLGGEEEKEPLTPPLAQPPLLPFFPLTSLLLERLGGVREERPTLSLPMRLLYLSPVARSLGGLWERVVEREEGEGEEEKEEEEEEGEDDGERGERPSGISYLPPLHSLPSLPSLPYPPPLPSLPSLPLPSLPSPSSLTSAPSLPSSSSLFSLPSFFTSPLFFSSSVSSLPPVSSSPLSPDPSLAYELKIGRAQQLRAPPPVSLPQVTRGDRLFLLSLQTSLAVRAAQKLKTEKDTLEYLSSFNFNLLLSFLLEGGEGQGGEGGAGGAGGLGEGVEGMAGIDRGEVLKGVYNVLRLHPPLAEELGGNELFLSLLCELLEGGYGRGGFLTLPPSPFRPSLQEQQRLASLSKQALKIILRIVRTSERGAEGMRRSSRMKKILFTIASLPNPCPSLSPSPSPSPFLTQQPSSPFSTSPSLSVLLSPSAPPTPPPAISFPFSPPPPSPLFSSPGEPRKGKGAGAGGGGAGAGAVLNTSSVVEYDKLRPQQMARVAAWGLGGVPWRPKQANHRGLRILSLDGGGTRGVLSIALLKEIFQRINSNSNKPPLCPTDCFDLICGTSTGGIIAMLLGGQGRGLGETEALYDDFIGKIFAQRNNIRLVREGGAYDERAFEEILYSMGGEMLMLDSNIATDTRVFLVSTKVNTSPPQTTLWRNYHHPPDANAPAPYPGNYLIPAVTAVRATTAAPTFFTPVSFEGGLYCDGALVANNPTALAIQEARSLFPQTPIECVVSVGTGFYVDRRDNLKSLPWDLLVNQLIASTTDTEDVHRLLKDFLPKDKYYRFNPPLDFNFAIDEKNSTLLGGLKTFAGEYYDALEKAEPKFYETLVKLLRGDKK